MNKLTKNKTAFLIFGSPRSGTSFISNVLSDHNIFFGGRKKLFIDPKLIPINPEFYELKSVNKINTSILTSLGFNYEDFDFIPDINKINKKNLNMFKTRIEKIISSDLENNKIIGIKDPRISFTFPIWKDVLTRLNYNVIGVACFRSIDDVVTSNKKSNNLRNDVNILIPGIHYLATLNILNNYPNVSAINYNKVLNNNYSEFKTILGMTHIIFKKNIVKQTIKPDYIRNSSATKSNIFYDIHSYNINYSYLNEFINSLVNVINTNINNKYKIKLQNKEKENNFILEEKKNTLKEIDQLKKYFYKVENNYLIRGYRYIQKLIKNYDFLFNRRL
jgi:hypothetical protein